MLPFILKGRGDGSPFVGRRSCGLEGYLYRSLEDPGLVERCRDLAEGSRCEGRRSSGCAAECSHG